MTTYKLFFNRKTQEKIINIQDIALLHRFYTYIFFIDFYQFRIHKILRERLKECEFWAKNSGESFLNFMKN